MSESACPVHAGFDLKDFPQMNTASVPQSQSGWWRLPEFIIKLNTTHCGSHAFLLSVFLAVLLHLFSFLMSDLGGSTGQDPT